MKNQKNIPNRTSNLLEHPINTGTDLTNTLRTNLHGDLITFSEFANILFPYCSNGMKPADFVVMLVNKIMAGRPGRAYKEDSYRNPLCAKADRTLLSYFHGDRNISRKDASTILGSIDKYRFEMYLKAHCSDDALKLLWLDISRRFGTKDIGDVIEFCSDQFELILKARASRNI